MKSFIESYDAILVCWTLDTMSQDKTDSGGKVVDLAQSFMRFTNFSASFVFEQAEELPGLLQKKSISAMQQLNVQQMFSLAVFRQFEDMISYFFPELIH